MASMRSLAQPFALSLSKGHFSSFALEGEGKGFDELGLTGLGGRFGE